jgi:ribose transport system ATP-binding protein
MMVGRELVRGNTAEKRAIGEVILDVRLISGKCFKDVSFNVREGEIVGFFGLVGAGRSEIAHAIFGGAPLSSGTIVWQKRIARFKSPADAIRNGIALVPEDRKDQSLFMGLPINLNMSITRLPKISRKGIIDNAGIRKIIKKFTAMLNIKMASPDYPVSSLSGGNQQKVVLSRWLATDPSLLILDEPTHGIDVGAKVEIYKLMRELTSRGLSIILISSELPEIILLSDRVVILHEGSVSGILNHDELSEDRIMEYATKTESNGVS